MKTRILMVLIVAGAFFTSCDKNKEHYGAYNCNETRSYDGQMMAGDVDLSDQKYILTIEKLDKEKVTVKDLYKSGTQIEAELFGSTLTIEKQSLDGFLEVEGSAIINDGSIDLDYKVITPDGNVLCDLSATK